jgi:hypothetical protein
MEAMDLGEDSNGLTRLPGLESSSCPAGPDDVNRSCNMCHDQFEQFFNEETEEWHLRSAIKVDDKFFHPICYEDYKVSISQSNEFHSLLILPRLFHSLLSLSMSRA